MKLINLSFLTIWFIACSGLILWIGTTNKNEFDSDLVLSQAIMDMNFEESLMATLAAQSASYSSSRTFQPNQNFKGRIYHINQGDCYCEWLAQPHQRKLDQWGQDHDFTTTYIDLNRASELKKYVPSTPAVIAVSEDNELIYFGPYSRGSGCFATNGMVDEQLALWLKNRPQASSGISLGTVIETEVSGCYCIT